RVAPTPFTHRQKNLSTETLAMLERLSGRHAAARPALLEATSHALAHENADVQSRALKVLEKYADDVPRATLLGYVEAVSPTLRGRLEALSGLVRVVQDDVRVIEIRAPIQPVLSLEHVLAGRTTVAPVASVGELIELAAVLLEGQGDGDDCERFLDGVSRLCDQRPPGFERQTEGLAKRAEATSVWGTPVPIGYIIQAWTRGRRQRVASPPATFVGFLGGRVEEVAKRAVRGVARPLLALPTHSGGWIDPDVLEARERATGRVFNRPDPLDR